MHNRPCLLPNSWKLRTVGLKQPSSSMNRIQKDKVIRCTTFWYNITCIFDVACFRWWVYIMVWCLSVPSIDTNNMQLVCYSLGASGTYLSISADCRWCQSSVPGSISTVIWEGLTQTFQWTTLQLYSIVESVFMNYSVLDQIHQKRTFEDMHTIYGRRIILYWIICGR